MDAPESLPEHPFILSGMPQGSPGALFILSGSFIPIAVKVLVRGCELDVIIT